MTLKQIVKKYRKLENSHVMINFCFDVYLLEMYRYCIINKLL